jgi:hypothetical protein
VKVKEKRVLERVPAIKPAEFRRIEKLTSRLADAVITAKEISDKAGGALEAIAAAIRSTHAPAPTPAPINPRLVARSPVPRIVAAPVAQRKDFASLRERVTSSGNGSMDERLAREARDIAAREELEGPEKRVLDSIAFWESIGVESPEDPAVAFKAGYSPTSSAYERPRGQLRTHGLITFVGNGRRLTDRGRELAQFPSGAGTLEALHEQFKKILAGPERKLLANLLAAYPHALSNEDLAEKSGYSVTSSAYERPRGKLRTIGLAEFRDGGVAATPLLFPDSLLQEVGHG